MKKISYEGLKAGKFAYYRSITRKRCSISIIINYVEREKKMVIDLEKSVGFPCVFDSHMTDSTQMLFILFHFIDLFHFEIREVSIGNDSCVSGVCKTWICVFICLSFSDRTVAEHALRVFVISYSISECAHVQLKPTKSTIIKKNGKKCRRKKRENIFIKT